ncbi:hypothetical protein V490_06003 [Pseudogymnoascus sp. VKM F-3557]|nr:hypothetical protein V490_06003 [Pseudogymnoascus sp. VKM F-3557]
MVCPPRLWEARPENDVLLLRLSPPATTHPSPSSHPHASPRPQPSIKVVTSALALVPGRTIPRHLQSAGKKQEKEKVE